MKKNLTKKLMLSVLTLAFAVVSLGASTFAWFTVGGTNQSASLNANVVGGIGLDVAVTKPGQPIEKWYSGGSTQLNNDIKAIINEFNTGDATNNKWTFTAVTPAEKLVFGKNEFKTQDEALAKANTNNGKGYVAFDLHFKLSDNTIKTQYDLQLSQMDITTSGAKEWLCDYALPVSEKDIISLNTKNYYNVLSALRFAMIQKGDGGFYKIFEQDGNENVSTEEDTQDGNKVTLKYVSNGYNTEGFCKEGYGAVQYYENKTNSTVEIATNNNESTEQLKKAAGADKISYTNKIASISGDDQIVSISVLLWVEGWDAECLNAIFSQNIKLDLTFALYENGKAVENPQA